MPPNRCFRSFPPSFFPPHLFLAFTISSPFVMGERWENDGRTSEGRTSREPTNSYAVIPDEPTINQAVSVSEPGIGDEMTQE